MIEHWRAIGRPQEEQWHILLYVLKRDPSDYYVVNGDMGTNEVGTVAVQPGGVDSLKWSSSIRDGEV